MLYYIPITYISTIHIRNKRLVLNNLNNHLRQLRFLLSSKHVTLHNKILIYKVLLKPIWSYGIQLWGSAKDSNTNRIQTFQSKCLRQITKAPFYVSNDTLHSDLLFRQSKTSLKPYTNVSTLNLQFIVTSSPKTSPLEHSRPPGNPGRRLKGSWCRDLLID
uniref:Putative RNA-directed DNA polymerase n=1 Tax=Schizaphis graminum TaxID=13262 RepID=A0A2S2NBP8_SCHGA